MRQLSAVPWLSSSGRIALSILCVATLVCGAFGLLKISIGEKQAPNKELTKALSNGLLLSVSQNLAILWLLSWSRPLWLNPPKG